jgi:hypothetical protein
MLPASIVALVVLYTFMYKPNKNEKYFRGSRRRRRDRLRYQQKLNPINGILTRSPFYERLN